jgi:hypothetical protein
MKRKLDPLRIRTLFQPWLDSLTGRYPVLTDPVVRNIVLAAAQRGTSLDSLSSQLSPFFPRAKDLPRFLRSYDSSVAHFVSSEIRGNFPRHASPPRHSREARRPLTPAAAPPSFFLGSDVLSLRRSDQRPKPLLLNERGERVDASGDVTTEFNRKRSPSQPIPFDRRIPTVAKLATRAFSFLEPGSVCERLEVKRREVAADLSVAAGFPLFDALALQCSIDTPTVDWWDVPFMAIDGDAWAPVYDSIDNRFENAAPIQTPREPVRESPTVLTPAAPHRPDRAARR